MNCKNNLRKFTQVIKIFCKKVLTNRFKFAIISTVDAAMAQLVEHILGKDEVISSTLISSSRKASGIPGAFSVFVCRVFRNFAIGRGKWQAASFFADFTKGCGLVLFTKIMMNGHVDTSLADVYESFILSQTSRGVSDATVCNYRSHLKGIGRKAP